ncbi:uncharacterized protein ARMOST_22159 [Armillaria ostoyae]|uniref:Uncharacterized protein n=1 Tax=Armillaria ostoyae TaxID=47428 RepID=A0A284SC37_ARMOS|nr:uncharacterized protein ARMOST_22159 [Armillaria ostoyae]
MPYVDADLQYLALEGLNLDRADSFKVDQMMLISGGAQFLSGAPTHRQAGGLHLDSFNDPVYGDAVGVFPSPHEPRAPVEHDQPKVTFAAKVSVNRLISDGVGSLLWAVSYIIP